MVGPPTSPPPPSPIQQLQQRSAQLAKMKDDLHKAPGRAADKELVEQEIDKRKRVVDEELALRKKILDSTAASVADPDPGVGHGHGKWVTREQARAKERTDATTRLNALRASEAAIYGGGNIANPCMPCMQAFVNLVTSLSALIPLNPLLKNKLVKVEILDGFPAGGNPKTDPALASKGLQWVNLRKYRDNLEPARKPLPAWLQSFDGFPVTSVDRLSRKIRVRVKFALPRVENFIVKLIPGTKDHYTVTERGTNSGYQVSPHAKEGKPEWLYGTTDADGIGVVDLYLRAAGGETFTVQGKDNYGTKLPAPGSLETVRGFFVCTVTMDQVAAVSTANAVAEFKRQKVHLEIAELTPGAAGKVPYTRFFRADDPRWNAEVARTKAEVRTAVRSGTFKGTRLADMMPYMVIAHFYDMSPDYPDRWHGAQGVSPVSASSYMLQQQLHDPTDTVDWFRSSRAFKANGDELFPSPTKANFVPVGSAANGYTSLTFTPPAAWAAEPSVTLWVQTRVIDGGVNGFSSGEQGQANFVAICRRHAYVTRGLGEMNKTIVHELGHKVNFTTGPEKTGAVNPEAQYGPANGSVFRWLDRSSTHYIGRGHQGGHCYNGAVLNPTPGHAGGAIATSLKPDFSLYDGRCVMFGSGGADSKRPITFCPSCTRRMTKLDLETGWVAL